MVETSKPNFSGAPIRPKGPKREQAKGPFLAHAWRFLTDRELAVPPHAPPRPPVDDAAIEALVQSRVEASLEASVAQVPLRFGRSVDGGDSRGLPPPAQRDSDGPGLDAESAEALNERTLQTFGAPSHVSSFSALSQQREPPAPGRSRRPRALTEHGNLFDDRADELLSQRVEAGVARLGEPEWEPTVHNGGLERLRPPAPIVIWRPPEMVRIATNIPPELDKPRVDARFATLLKKNADVRASFRTPSASAGLKDSELRSPRPVPVKGSPRARKLLEAQRANVAVDQLRSTHALQLKNSNAKPPRQCVKYGAWYMPTNQWQPVFAENTSDAAADGAAALVAARAAADESDESGWGTELRAFKLREKQLRQEIAKVYISKQFKQFIDEHGYRLPSALEPLNVETASLTGFDRNMLAYMLPVLKPMFQQSTQRVLSRDFQNSCDPRSSTLVPVSVFRQILAHHGFYFNENEFHNLVAIAPADANEGRAKRHAKVDYHLFMLRCSEALKKAEQTTKARFHSEDTLK